MYNGIGLQTARGSGTNGYVQRNLSAVRKHTDRVDYKSEEELKKLEAQFNRKPNKDILEHDRKRQVEVKCMEMQDLMEDQGFTEEEIAAKVTLFRKLLMEKEAVSDSSAVLKDDFGRPIATETHQIALATEEKNARWRDAFGIAPREDEKKAFGEEMEKRWEREEREEEQKQDEEEEEGRRKEKKKKHRREQSEEREERKKHKKRRSRSPVESPHKKDRRHRSRSPRRKRDESPKRSRRRSSSSPESSRRSRKKR